MSSSNNYALELEAIETYSRLGFGVGKILEDSANNKTNLKISELHKLLEDLDLPMECS